MNIIVISEVKADTSLVSSWPGHPRQYLSLRGPPPPVSVGPQRARLCPSDILGFSFQTHRSVTVSTYFFWSLPPRLSRCLLVSHLVEDVEEYSVFLLVLLSIRLQSKLSVDQKIIFPYRRYSGFFLWFIIFFHVYFGDIRPEL